MNENHFSNVDSLSFKKKALYEKIKAFRRFMGFDYFTQRSSYQINHGDEIDWKKVSDITY